MKKATYRTECNNDGTVKTLQLSHKSSFIVAQALLQSKYWTATRECLFHNQWTSIQLNKQLFRIANLYTNQATWNTAATPIRVQWTTLTNKTLERIYIYEYTLQTTVFLQVSIMDDHLFLYRRQFFFFQRSKQTSRLGRLQHTVHRRSHSSAFSKPTRGLLVDLFKPSQHNGSYCNLVSGTCHPAPASKHKIQKKHEHLLSTPHLTQLQHRHLQFHLVNPICSKSGLYCAICAKVLLSNTLLCIIASALIQYHVYQVIKTTTLLQTSFFVAFYATA